jgi:Putative Ig domain
MIAMPSSVSRKMTVLLIFGSSAVFLYGCGGSQAIPPAISVSLSPSSAQTLDQGQSVNVSAIVANDAANQGVSWSLSGTGCTGATCGALSNRTATSATYAAPSAVTASLSVRVSATSVTDGTKSTNLSVAVVPPPAITTNSLPNATAGTPYSGTLQATGGIAPYHWTVTAGAPPSGIDVNPDGSISGTAGGAGASHFTVQVADAANPPLTATTNLTITSVVLPVSITTTTLPNGTVDTAYKQSVQASGGIPPYTWSIAGGALPSWATLDASLGIISGIPGSSGSANFTVQVADSQSPALTDTQTLTLTVTAGSAANNSELNGHYAFLLNGFDDAASSPIAVAGSFTADGKGKISGGIEDENGPSGPALNVPFSGTYNIGSDLRGAFTLVTASGSKTYALVLNSIASGVAQKARFIEFDDKTGTNGQRGSGIMRLQDTTAFAQGKIKGPYAFGFEGQDATGEREAIVGSFTADGAGTIPSGTADQNIAGTASNPSLTGTYAAPSGSNGRASMKLDPSAASSLDLAAYVVSANELLVLTTKTFSSSGLISGAIFSQSSTSFDNAALDAPAVYYQLGVGQNASESSAEIGLLVPDGAGALSTSYDKSNQGGTQAVTFTATYSVVSAGRVTVSGWYGMSSSPLRILYLLDKNKAFFLDTDAAVGLGFVEPQSPPSGGFSKSFFGTFSLATAAPAVSLDANGCGFATLDASGSYNQVADLSSISSRVIDESTSGNYSVATNGRGTVTNIRAVDASMIVLGLLVLMAPVLGSRKPRSKSLSAALMCLTILFATIAAGCTFTNQLVFYAISPTKAVMIHQSQILDPAPVISIIER